MLQSGQHKKFSFTKETRFAGTREQDGIMCLAKKIKIR